MEIFKNEFIKLFGSKSVVMIFIGFAVLNISLLLINVYRNNDYVYSPESYRTICAELSSFPNEEAYKKVEEYYKKVNFCLYLLEGITYEEELDSNLKSAATDDFLNNNYLKFTDNIWKEIELYKDVMYEIENCITYQDYLNNIDKAASDMKIISYFSDPESFLYKNIIKTPGDYANLKEHTLKFDCSKGVKLATESFETDLIGVLLIIIICVLLITREKEQEQFHLLRTTCFGRGSLAIKKLLVAIFSCFIIEVLLYGSNFLIAYKVYGFGYMNRFIQSVDGYTGSNLSITVQQYFILFLLLKLLVYQLIAALIFFITIISKISVQVYIYLTVIFGISGINYYMISATSWLSPLKYINIVSFLDTHKLFSNYININVLGNPVNYYVSFYIVTGLLLTILWFLSVLLFCNKKFNKAESKFIIQLQDRWNRLNIRKMFTSTSVLNHECYKILIGGKVLFLILLFGFVVWYQYSPMKEDFENKDQLYYKKYALKLEGEFNNEKEAYLEAEEKRLLKIEEDMIASMEHSDSSDFILYDKQNQLAPKQALQDMILHTEYIKEKANRWILYDTGYKYLTGGENSNNMDQLLALMAMVMTIASLVYVYTVEHQNGFYCLLKTTYRGRRYTFAIKSIISIIIITIIYGLTYAPFFYNVLNTYGTRALSAPADSMEHLSNIPLDVNILEYLILISFTRYIGLMIAMLLIFLLSMKLKSYIATLLASVGLFVLPLLLSLLGIRLFDFFLLNPLLIGNVLS